MAQFDFETTKQSRVDMGSVSSGAATNPAPLALQKVPGLSYIPDKIEIAEDQVLMAKVNRQMLDFIKILSQLLDLMWIIKPKHLKSTQPIPAIIIEELLLNQGKGLRLKALEAKLTDPAPVASPSVENVLKSQSHQPMHSHRREVNHKPQQPVSNFPFANDLQEITGKKTRPLWHVVMLEKPEELSILQPKPPRVPSFVFNNKTTYQQCRVNEELTRTKSETTMFSVKFAWNDFVNLNQNDERLQKQIEMMVASQAGFRTVEEHKAYLSTLKSHWYNNFLNDVIKVGLLTCSDVVLAFENLAKHYHMNYNSLPLAKSRLCLIVMSLPFWDIARIETQRAAEFILEKILLLPEKPLKDWLRVRGIPYVVYPAYCAEDLMLTAEEEQVQEEEEANAVPVDDDKSTETPTVNDNSHEV